MNNVSRRNFLKGFGIVGATTLLTACGEQARNTEAPASDAGQDVTAESTDKTQSADATSAPASPEDEAMVVVFSRADENYGVGTVETGNTMVLAQMIAEATGAELFEIERTTPYPAGYDECCDEAKVEQDEGARPELKSMPDISNAQTIYLGFPCWWGDLPMPVYTLIEALDWNGKTICPFDTHAGSGDSAMLAALERTCEGATIAKSLSMAGTTAQQQRDEARSQVESWLASL